MKCSFGISDFLEEIPSLSHSVVFLYFFALITEAGFLYYRVANILVELCLCPGVLWQVELVINEIEYLVEAISKQSIKGAT